MTRVDLADAGWGAIRISGSALVESALLAKRLAAGDPPAWLDASCVRCIPATICEATAHELDATPQPRVWSWGTDWSSRPSEAGVGDCLTAGLEALWAACLSSRWAALAGIIEAEVVRRGVQLALDGAPQTVASVPAIMTEADALMVSDDEPTVMRPTDAPVVLCPSVSAGRTMVWPNCDFPVIVYPVPRRAPAVVPSVAAALFGRRRATILLALRDGTTTMELAALLDVSPSAVSQHMQHLRDAGFATGTRVGRYVFYVLTPEGEVLLDSLPSPVNEIRADRAI